VVVGATADSSGDTRPAVWTSDDGQDWHTVPLDPGGDYYVAREIIGTVACSHGRLAMLGSKSGGAHGMPRTATWRQLPDGSMASVPTPFALFAGSETVVVGRMSGGPAGYLVAGARTSGAAVWQSPTGARFRLYDGARGMANTPDLQPQALDALPYDGQWLVVGDAVDAKGRLRAEAWTGDVDAPWQRMDIPGGSVASTAERVVRTGWGPTTAGLLDDGFGLWSLHDGTWTLRQRFGTTDPDGTAANFVSGLAAPVGAAGSVAATYSDGAHFRLWVGQDVPMPTSVTVDGNRSATVAAHGRRLLLLTDDDHAGKAWLTTIPRPRQ
jgi:hypothetical protein